MTTTGAGSGSSAQASQAGTVDMKLEVVTVPVSDVDQAKRFYQGLGWRLGADITAGDAFRVVHRARARALAGGGLGGGGPLHGRSKARRGPVRTG